MITDGIEQSDDPLIDVHNSAHRSGPERGA
jgi:hypothetical protein